MLENTFIETILVLFVDCADGVVIISDTPLSI